MTEPDVTRSHEAPAADLVALAQTGDQPTRTHDPLTAGGTTTAPAGELPSIDGYQVLAEIDRGGMGVVYHARQVMLNREVALKVVLHSDPKSLVRFLAEAEAIAAVRHPHVVQVFDSGRSDGRPYLAMELCPGGTLATRFKGGKLTPRAAAELLAKVADGVGAAHAAGVIHRDLKPGNVLFDAAGEPKVADFGLAKRGESDLTRTDAVMGTPAYMSPEQAAGGTKFVGPQADVWALGVMLYEALTGTRPFHAPDPMAVMIKVMAAEPVSVRASSREVPRELDLIVNKCLAKEPAERYPTAAELAADLRNWLAGRPIAARPAGAVESVVKWVRRNKFLAGAVAMVAVTLVGATAVSLTYAVQADRSAADARIALAQRDDALEAEKKGRADAAEKRREITAKVITFVSERPTLLTLDRGLFIDDFHAHFPEVEKKELIKTIAYALTETVEHEVAMIRQKTRTTADGKAETYTVTEMEKVTTRQNVLDRVPTSPVAALTGFAPMTKNLAEISDAFARQSEGGGQTGSSFAPNMFGD